MIEWLRNVLVGKRCPVCSAGEACDWCRGTRWVRWRPLRGRWEP